MNFDQVDQAANWFEAFLRHGSIISVLLSLFFGWGLSIFLSFPIHRSVKDDELATFYARCACVVGSFLITAGTWPNEFRWSWALAMGVMSPLLGLLVLAILSKWKPEIVANVLSMKKVSPPQPNQEPKP